MARIVVTKSLSGGLVAFFEESASTLSMAFQPVPGTWSHLNPAITLSAGGHFVPSTLAFGDNSGQPVFGVVVTAPGIPAALTLMTNTGTAAATNQPQFTQSSVPAPSGFTPSMLALGAGNQTMVANASHVFAVHNTAGITASSWAPVGLPSGVTVRALALSTSKLFGAVPEAFVLTNTAVLHSTANTAGVWAPFTTLNTPVPARGIAVLPNGNNLVDAVILANDGRILHAHQTVQGSAPAFLDWHPLPALNQPVVSSAATSNSLALARVLGSGSLPLLTVFVTAQNGAVFTAQQSAPDSNVWNAWRPLPLPPPDVFTSVAASPGATTLVDVITASANLFHSQQNVSAFDPWAQFPRG